MWFLLHQLFFFTVTLRSMANSCLCENKKIIGTNGSDEALVGKRELQNSGYPSNKINNYKYDKSDVNSVSTKANKFNVTRLKSYEEETNSPVTKSISEVCPQFKNTSSLDVDKMADVWQTAYFRMSESVSCFKIYIKKTSEKERKRLSRKYGDFGKIVDWDNCLLEIKSGETQYNFIRKHYLQGNGSNNGILANIILEENEKNGNLTRLHEETADQWLVINNLLMMRDCENGDVAVFSRVPHQPRLHDVWHGLETFGENAMNGTLACLDDDRVQRSIKNVMQEVLFRFRLF